MDVPNRPPLNWQDHTTWMIAVFEDAGGPGLVVLGWALRTANWETGYVGDVRIPDVARDLGTSVRSVERAVAKLRKFRILETRDCGNWAKWWVLWPVHPGQRLIERTRPEHRMLVSAVVESVVPAQSGGMKPSSGRMKPSSGGMITTERVNQDSGLLIENSIDQLSDHDHSIDRAWEVFRRVSGSRRRASKSDRNILAEALETFDPEDVIKAIEGLPLFCADWPNPPKRLELRWAFKSTAANESGANRAVWDPGRTEACIAKVDRDFARAQASALEAPERWTSAHQSDFKALVERFFAAAPERPSGSISAPPEMRARYGWSPEFLPDAWVEVLGRKVLLWPDPVMNRLSFQLSASRFAAKAMRKTSSHEVRLTLDGIVDLARKSVHQRYQQVVKNATKENT